MFSCNLVNRFVLLVFFHRIFDKKTDFPLGSLRKVFLHRTADSWPALILQSPIDLRSLSPHCLRRRRHGHGYPSLSCEHESSITQSFLLFPQNVSFCRSPNLSRSDCGWWGVSALCCRRRLRELSGLFGIGVYRSSVACVTESWRTLRSGSSVSRSYREVVIRWSFMKLSNARSRSFHGRKAFCENKNRTSRPSGCQILWLSMSGYGHWEEY